MLTLPEALAPLAAYKQFILYQVVPSKTRPGKSDKFPIDYRNGRMPPKGSNGAFYKEMWTDAQTACDTAAKFGKSFGIGFVFTPEDPFWFIDIDSCLQADGNWSPTALTVAGMFPGVAVELSSSRNGLHLFGTGKVPIHGCRNEKLGMEFYTEGRFVALTGLSTSGTALMDCTPIMPGFVSQYFPPTGTNLLPEGSAPAGSIADEWTAAVARGVHPNWRGPEDDSVLLERALKSQSARSAFGTAASFYDLWYCTVDVLAKCYPDNSGQSDRPYDASSADRALTQHLAFWTGKDCLRILRMLLQSELKRDKWDRDDYLQRTIMGAVAVQVDVLQDKPPQIWDAVSAPASSDIAEGTPQQKYGDGNFHLSFEGQIALFKGCVWVVDRDAVLIPGGVLLTEKKFKTYFRGYTFTMDKTNEKVETCAWQAFIHHKWLHAPQADGVCFKPQRAPAEVITRSGRTLANMWWPVEVPRAQGDAMPFIVHLNKILPAGEDALILLSYMAACVQYKGYKIQWAPVLQGVEGNGKTLFTRCVAEALGHRYVHWPKASQLASEFNGWLQFKLFYGVEDVYVPSGKMEIWEELKPMITGGDGLEIQCKGVDQVSADICGNFIFNTNHKDGLRKTGNDRRLSVFFSAQQEAEHLVRDGMDGDYFPKLYAWLKNGGFAIVSDLLHTFPIPERYNPTGICQRAPRTTSFHEAVEAGRSTIEQHIMDAVEQDTPGFAGGYISTLAVDRLLERLGIGKQIAPNKRRDLIQGLGYVPHPHLVGGRVNNLVLPDGGKPRLFLLRGHPDLQIMYAADVARAYTKAQEPRGIHASS